MNHTARYPRLCLNNHVPVPLSVLPASLSFNPPTYIICNERFWKWRSRSRKEINRLHLSGTHELCTLLVKELSRGDDPERLRIYRRWDVLTASLKGTALAESCQGGGQSSSPKRPPQLSEIKRKRHSMMEGRLRQQLNTRTIGGCRTSPLSSVRRPILQLGHGEQVKGGGQRAGTSPARRSCKPDHIVSR